MPSEKLAHGDENEIAKAIRDAIGVGDFEHVEVVTPQFERDDGGKVYYYPKTSEEIDDLKKASESVLKDIGLSIWARAEDGSWVHWLFPAEWYDHIPSGYPIVDICNQVEAFVPGVTDNDRRYGVLAYGFVVGDQAMTAPASGS